MRGTKATKACLMVENIRILSSYLVLYARDPIEIKDAGPY